MIPYVSGKKLIVSFKQFINQIKNDAMLFMACIAPVLCGMLFKFGIPYAERALMNSLSRDAVLSPYFLIFDLFLSVLTPMMFCFVSSMVMLEEIDDGIAKYFAITPLGKSGYLFSRLGFSMIISFFMTIIVMYIFSLSRLNFGIIILISIVSSMLGYIMSIMVISISSNKVEGMAAVKLSGITMLGIPAPFFVNENIQFLFSPLPSFWISKYVLDNNIVYIIMCFVVSIAWISFFFNKFMQKLN